MSLSNPVFVHHKSKPTKSRTPLKQFDLDNVRRSPRKKKEVVDRGRRKLDFHKDVNKKLVKERLKRFVAYVDVQSFTKQNEIKERIVSLGGKIEEFLDKNVNLVVTSQRPVEKTDGRVAENSPLSGAGPSPLPQQFSNKNSMMYSPCSTESPQYSVEGVKKERIFLSRGQKLASKVVVNRKGTADIRETARTIGARVLSVEEFTRKYMHKKSTSEASIKSLKNKPLQALKKSSSASRVVADVQVTKLTAPFFKIEDQTRAFRPIIYEFKEWPKLHYDTSLVQTPFDLPKPKNKVKSIETRRQEQVNSKEDDEETISIDLKSVGKVSGTIDETASKKTDKKEKSEKKKTKEGEEKPGYCDCCNLRYKELKKHLKSDNHRRFARDSANFKKLDDLIRTGNKFEQFLNDLKAVARLQKFNRDLFNENAANEGKVDPCKTSAASITNASTIPVATTVPSTILLSTKPADEKKLPVPVFNSPVNLISTTNHLLLSPKRPPCFQLRSPVKSTNLDESPLRTPQAGENRSFSFPEFNALNNETVPQTSSPISVANRLLFTIVSTPNDPLVLKSTAVPSKSNTLEKNDNIGKSRNNENNEAVSSQLVKTPRSEEIKRKVKRKHRKSSHRSSQSQQTVTTQEKSTPEEYTKILMEETIVEKNNQLIIAKDENDKEQKEIVEESEVSDCLHQSHSEMIFKMNAIPDDPYRSPDKNKDCIAISKEAYEKDIEQSKALEDDNKIEKNVDMSPGELLEDRLRPQQQRKSARKRSKSDHAVEVERRKPKNTDSLMNRVDELDRKMNFRTRSKSMSLDINCKEISRQPTDGKIDSYESPLRSTERQKSLRNKNKSNQPEQEDINSVVEDPLSEDSEVILNLPISLPGLLRSPMLQKDQEKEIDAISPEEDNRESDRENLPKIDTVNEQKTILDNSLNSTCELTVRTETELNKEEDFTDHVELMKSYASEMFSDESVKENTEPTPNTFLGFKDLGLGNFCDVSPPIDEALVVQSNDMDEVMFSDDEDASDIKKKILKLSENFVKVEEFNNVDDISVSILKQGSTPKGVRTTRTRLKSQNDEELSPAVTRSFNHTPKKDQNADENLLQSPLSCKNALRSSTKCMDGDLNTESGTPMKSRRHSSKKRTLSTPEGERFRKRSRTDSHTSYCSEVTTTTNTEANMAESEKKHDAVDVNCDEVFEHNQVKLTIKKPIKTKTKTKTKHDSLSKKPTCVDFDLVSKFFGSGLYDRIKNTDRKASPNSNSPKHRKRAVSEKLLQSPLLQTHSHNTGRKHNSTSERRNFDFIPNIRDKSVSEHCKIDVDRSRRSSPRKKDVTNKQNIVVGHRSSPRKKAIQSECENVKTVTIHRSSPRKKIVHEKDQINNDTTIESRRSSPRKMSVNAKDQITVDVKIHRSSPCKKTVTPNHSKNPSSKNLGQSERQNGNSKHVKSKLKKCSPFGDPKMSGKTHDKNRVAILEEFADDNIEHNASHNISLNSSMKSKKTPNFKKKNKEKKTTKRRRLIDDTDESMDNDDFDDFIPTNYRTPKMSRK